MNLQEWLNFWQQCDETHFHAFSQQNSELLANLQESWRQFTTENFNVEKNQTATDFRQPENEMDVPKTEIILPELPKLPENPPQNPEENAFRQPENLPTEMVVPEHDLNQNHQQNQVNMEINPMPPAQHITPLPNARKGELYSAQLPPNAQNLSISPECGLIWDENTQQITGTPHFTGNVEIAYYLLNNNHLDPIRQSLYINPNPQDLWNNIPTDANIRFYKSDSFQELVPTPHGNLIAARVRGRSHAHVGKPCDDDFSMFYHERTGVHFIAVSDGAGSAAFSRLGSQVAVDTARDTVWHLLESGQDNYTILPNQDIDNYGKILVNLVNHAAYQAMASLHQTAKNEQIELKQLSCTLLFLLGFELDNGQWLSASYQVGDGALAIFHPETQSLDFIGEGDSGSYSGETRFLSANETTPESLKQRTRLKLSEKMPVLLLMTDGVSDPKFETDNQLKNPQKWQDLWSELKEIFQNNQNIKPEIKLTEWLNFWSVGNHDDRTLAMFIPHNHVDFRQPETENEHIAPIHENPQTESTE